ncbi:MAG: hypothetical protein ACPGVD_06370 [Flavobacteriales bacterium]
MRGLKIIGVLFVFAFTSCTNSNTPENVIEQFYKAVKAEDYDKAKTFLSASSKKTADLLSGNMEVTLGGLDLKNVDCITKGLTSDCDCFVEGKDKPIAISVLKESGEWKIDIKESLMDNLNGLLDNFNIDLKNVDVNGLLDVGQKLIEGNTEKLNELIENTDTDKVIESLNAIDTSLNITKENVEEFMQKIQDGLNKENKK